MYLFHTLSGVAASAYRAANSRMGFSEITRTEIDYLIMR